MVISPKFKAVFVHVPKAGGTSIRSVLKQWDPYLVELKGHLRASEGQRLLEFQWMDWYRFGVCRHPCDQLVSHYLHIKRDDKHMYYGLVKGMEFGEWVRWYTDGIRAGASGYFLDAPMTRILRFERLQEGFASVCVDLGIPARRLPELNAAVDRRPWREYFDDGLLNYVGQHYSEDFRRFDYSA